jgi:hypothetical protein
MASEWRLDDPSAREAIGEFFAGAATGAATFGWTSSVVAGLGRAVVRLTATQVAFRHRIGFAWIWLPGTWLAHPDAEVVLSLGLRQRLDSPRWKQVVEPYPGRWMHHLGGRVGQPGARQPEPGEADPVPERHLGPGEADHRRAEAGDHSARPAEHRRTDGAPGEELPDGRHSVRVIELPLGCHRSDASW